MIFLSSILARYRRRRERIRILEEIIANLRAPEDRKALYRSSLEALDEQGLSDFYERLVSTFQKIDDERAEQTGKETRHALETVSEKERREQNTVDF